MINEVHSVFIKKKLYNSRRRLKKWRPYHESENKLNPRLMKVKYDKVIHELKLGEAVGMLDNIPADMFTKHTTESQCHFFFIGSENIL